MDLTKTEEPELVVKQSPHQKRREALINIIEACPIYKISNRAPFTYTGTNVEDATRITMQLHGNKLRVWKGNYLARTEFIKDIDANKFKIFIYNIAGLQYPGELNDWTS